MYGQKQIFQCLTVIVLITVLNFYRSAIRRDKETQKNLKMKREQQEKPQVDVSNVVETMAHQFDGDESESKWTQLEPQCDSDDCNAVGMSQFAVRPDSTLRNEKIDVCDNNEKTCSMADGRHHSTTKEVLDAEVHQNEINHNENDRDVNLKKTDSDKGITEKFQKQQQREKRSTTTGKTKANKRIITKTKINGSFIETAGVLTYIAVTILLASLIKAAVDVSKHTREVSMRGLYPLRLCVTLTHQMYFTNYLFRRGKSTFFFHEMKHIYNSHAFILKFCAKYLTSISAAFWLYSHCIAWHSTDIF